MPTVRGCHLPDDLYYDVDNHIWFRERADGTVQLGMTTVATAMAGQLVAFTPKKVGRDVQAGKSCATVESGKSVPTGRLGGVPSTPASNPGVVGVQSPVKRSQLPLPEPEEDPRHPRRCER